MFRSRSITRLSKSSISFYRLMMISSLSLTISWRARFRSISSVILVSKSCRALFILCSLSTVSSYVAYTLWYYSNNFSWWIYRVPSARWYSSYFSFVSASDYFKLYIFSSLSSYVYVYPIIYRLFIFSSELIIVICLIRSSHFSSYIFSKSLVSFNSRF